MRRRSHPRTAVEAVTGHALERTWTHYGLALTPAERAGLVRSIRSGAAPCLGPALSGGQVYRVLVREWVLYPVWKDRRVVTVLAPRAREVRAANAAVAAGQELGTTTPTPTLPRKREREKQGASPARAGETEQEVNHDHR